MTVDVLGLGESLHRYSKTGFAIGVNDIWRYHRTPVVVCVDNPLRFTKDRLRVIQECEPEMFYSHLNEWQFKQGYRRIQFMPVWNDLNDETFLPKSNNSTFVAACVAMQLGASRIRLWGVDITNHKTLSRKDHRKKALDDFYKLYWQMKRKGILLSCTRESALSAVMPTH